ncbi:MAG: DNA primase [Cellvibrionaceae bacterium]
MAGNIPRPFIDDLIDRVDIVEVIDHRVKLKKAGKNYSACCPFHDEKTPSFSVSPDKQFYYCFGCGATGNAIGFLMDYERITFPEAVDNLAKLAGLEVPREESSDPKQREREQAQEKARKSLYDLLDTANQYYQQQLREHSSKHKPVDYLKRRGLTGHIAKDFGIGYAPPGWDNVSSTIGTSNEKQDRLLEAGMLIHNEDKDSLYDRFRDRIMFPIRDTRGRVIGFGGRVLTDEKPKYLNSPETPIFHKGKELYGLFEARQAYKQLPRLLVVEGYMDVVALAQYGIRYGVATLGTACGEDHLARAFRFTNEIVFCFDGDEAGRKAARRAMENSLTTMEDGRQVKFLYLPEGEDPDTLIRQIGTDKFSRLVEGATPLESFLFEELGQNINTQTMEGRARLCKLAAPLLDQLPRGVYRELMFNQLANRTQLSVDALMTLLNELPLETAAHSVATTAASHKQPSEQVPYAATPYLAQEERPNPAPKAARTSEPKRYTQTQLSSDRAQKSKATASKLGSDELALALLLFQPKLAQAATDIEVLRHSANANIQLLVELIELLHQRPEYSSGQILGHWQGTYGMEKSEHLQQLLTKGALFHHINELEQEQKEHQFNAEQEFLDALIHLQKHQQTQDCRSIIQQLNSKPIESWTEAEKQLYSQAIAAQAQ